MKITLSEWLKLSRLRTTALEAFREYEHLMLMTALNHEGEERDLLISMADRLEFSAGLSCSPQSEWIGGDSSEPKNHKLREPDCVGLRKRHFTTEEMEEAGASCCGPCDWMFSQSGETK